jgi:hypothetical protein
MRTALLSRLCRLLMSDKVALSDIGGVLHEDRYGCSAAPPPPPTGGTSGVRRNSGVRRSSVVNEQGRSASERDVRGNRGSATAVPVSAAANAAAVAEAGSADGSSRNLATGAQGRDATGGAAGSADVESHDAGTRAIKTRRLLSVKGTVLLHTQGTLTTQKRLVITAQRRYNAVVKRRLRNAVLGCGACVNNVAVVVLRNRKRFLTFHMQPAWHIGHFVVSTAGLCGDTAAMSTSASRLVVTATVRGTHMELTAVQQRAAYEPPLPATSLGDGVDNATSGVESGMRSARADTSGGNATGDVHGRIHEALQPTQSLVFPLSFLQACVVAAPEHHSALGSREWCLPPDSITVAELEGHALGARIVDMMAEQHSGDLPSPEDVFKVNAASSGVVRAASAALAVAMRLARVRVYPVSRRWTEALERTPTMALRLTVPAVEVTSLRRRHARVLLCRLLLLLSLPP